MAVDRIKHSKPASQRTFLDELEPIPYEITEEEIAKMDPRMREVLFGIAEEEEETEELELTPAVEHVEEEESAADIEVEKAEEEDPVEDVFEEAPPFDPASLVAFGECPRPHITAIFPANADEDELIQVAKSSNDYQERVVEDRLWHVCRFTRHQAEELKRFNELLGEREDSVFLFNNKRVPFGRGLWAPLMYVFTASKVE